jgi:hypothetical protein
MIVVPLYSEIVRVPIERMLLLLAYLSIIV